VFALFIDDIVILSTLTLQLSQCSFHLCITNYDLNFHFNSGSAEPVDNVLSLLLTQICEGDSSSL